uniref:Uncharacterized protein n=1 Tax=Arundo donax TaxID=35708 RepID=A0A0A9BGK2_ARUDO
MYWHRFRGICYLSFFMCNIYKDCFGLLSLTCFTLLLEYFIPF